MMKSNEVRKGNFYKQYGKLMIVDGAFISRLEGLEKMGKVPTDVEPILITEEWYKRLGFENNKLQIEGEGRDGVWFRADLNSIGKVYFIACLCRGNYFADSVAINHVHQVQNLFFALTGKELQRFNPSS